MSSQGLTVGSSAPVRRAKFIHPISWNGDAGIRGIMAIALPMILSQSVHSINMWVDRTLLSWHSAEEFTACLQGGMLNWTFLTLFMSTVMYAGTFVAQYIGAKEERRVGAAVWQGIYMALLGGAILAAISPLAFPLFRIIGHEGNLPLLEAQYFHVLALGGVVFLLNAALTNFFTGRGKTMFVLFVNIASCTINFCLGVRMIFEPWLIFPAGIQGAAWATVLATACSVVIFTIFFFMESTHGMDYGVRRGWRFDRALCSRIIRFGLPSGFHNLIDMVGFTSFMMVVGVFGYEAQFGSNIAMSINFLLFIPAVGMHMAVMIISGQLCGAGRHREAQQMTFTVALLMTAYMLLVGIVYVGFPDMLIEHFRGKMQEGNWAHVYSLAKLLLVFVAIYSLFDSLLLTYSATLKGAGDTKFVMWASMIFSQLFLTGPCVLIWFFHEKFSSATQGLFVSWGFCSFYILFLAGLNMARYWAGKWQNIDVTGLRENSDDPTMSKVVATMAQNPQPGTQEASVVP